MQKLYSAANLPEAYLLMHQLEEAGIQAFVLNEHAQGGLGEIPFTHAYPEVWLVRSADAEKAKRIVSAYERPVASASSWICRSCDEENPGGFEVCWRCGATK